MRLPVLVRSKSWAAPGEIALGKRKKQPLVRKIDLFVSPDLMQDIQTHEYVHVCVYICMYMHMHIYNIDIYVYIRICMYMQSIYSSPEDR